MRLFAGVGLTLTLAVSLGVFTRAQTDPTGLRCVIPASNNGSDDSPAIYDAFRRCGRGGHITFQENATYNIQSRLQLEDLKDVQIDFLGTLLVSSTGALERCGGPNSDRCCSSRPTCGTGSKMVGTITSKTSQSHWASPVRILPLMDTGRVSSMAKDKCGMTVRERIYQSPAQDPR